VGNREGGEGFKIREPCEHLSQKNGEIARVFKKSLPDIRAAKGGGGEVALQGT